MLILWNQGFVLFCVASILAVSGLRFNRTFNNRSKLYLLPFDKNLLTSGDDNEEDIGIDNGSDVLLNRKGASTVKLHYKQLEFEFCGDCKDKNIQVCYPFNGTPSSATNFCPDMPNHCGFYLDKSSYETLKKEFPDQTCFTATMKYPRDDNIGKSSCDPLINADSSIKLHVPTHPSCSLKMKHASVYHKSATTPTASDDSAIHGTTPASNNANLGLYIGLPIGGLILLIIIIVFGVWFCRRWRAKRLAVKEAEEDREMHEYLNSRKPTDSIDDGVPTAVKVQPNQPKAVAKDKPVEPAKKVRSSKSKGAKKKSTPVKKAEKTTAAPEPSKPAEKKPRIYDPATAPPPILVVPRKVPAIYEGEEEIKRRTKSRRGTHSVSDQKKLHVLEVIEPIYDSLERHGLIRDPDVFEDMKLHYPVHIGRKLQTCEILLFVCPISEMFKRVQKLCVEAEKELVQRGARFDKKKRMTRMSREARRYLADPSTPEYVAHFAFAAEHHACLPDVPEFFNRYSLSLLFAIAMTPRFNEYIRRKVLKWIRYQLPHFKNSKLLWTYKSAFPLNVIDPAIELNSDGFNRVSRLNTFSDKEDCTQKSTSEGKTVSKVMNACDDAEDETQQSATQKKVKRGSKKSKKL